MHRDYAHGPQAYLDDSPYVDVSRLHEQHRPQTRGKHKYISFDTYNVPRSVSAIPIFNSNYQEPYRATPTGALPISQGCQVVVPPKFSQSPFHPSRGSVVSAEQHPSAHEPRPYPSYERAPLNWRLDDDAGDSQRADDCTSCVRGQVERRYCLSELAVSERSLDAFDLRLLEHIHSKQQFQQSEPPPSRHNNLVRAESEHLVSKGHQGYSLQPQFPESVAHLLLTQPSIPKPIQVFNRQLKLSKTTLESGRNAKAFNPYTMSHLFI